MLSALPALTSPPLLFAVASSAEPNHRRSNTARWFVPLSFVGAKENHRPSSSSHSQLGFRSFDAKTRGWSGILRRCRDWDSEDSDSALESDILEFMRNSGKPQAFPSKKELVDGGRMDLVDAILRKRGWLSLGWEFDEDDGDNDGCGIDDLSSGEEESRSSSMASFCPYDSDQSRSASSSGRSLETETTGNETGIEGILSRLEKERNRTFGFDSGDIEDHNFSSSVEGYEDWNPKFLVNGKTVAGPFKNKNSSSSSPKKTIFDNSARRLNHNNSLPNVDNLRSSEKPDTWRAWSTQRAIALDELKSKDTVLAKDGIQTETVDEPGQMETLGLQKHEEINHKKIRTRLQNLELELSTVLHAVRSSADEIVAQKMNQERSSDEMEKFTDTWEFQQNEIMNAKDKLRSTRAKIAVLEGKMALALIEAQKLVDQKRKRIDDARRALEHLRLTCIVWPNSASEVLLAGSFDGWESKRKMENSRTGIFSLSLRLYPGKYEIKFIVDGEWRVDPLRPTVINNGHENNLLIVT